MNLFSTLFKRNDRSQLSQWWWTIDKWMIGCVVIFILSGISLIQEVSPLPADRFEKDPSSYYFDRHLIFVALSIFVMIVFSFFSPTLIRILMGFLFIGTLGALILTLVIGEEVNGAQRWLPTGIGKLSVQPSEFLKPALVVISAWLLTRSTLPGNVLTILIILFITVLLLAQPDLGMTIIVLCICSTQFFIVGLRFIWVWIITCMVIIGLLSSYFFLPYVTQRVDNFYNPPPHSQISIAEEGYRNSKLIGRTSEQMQVRERLPDVHTDFILVIASEQFGLVGVLFILSVFTFFILRGLIRLLNESDLFIILTVSGLLVHMGLQVLINASSTLGLIPITGTTLPFISYGGSSLLTHGIGTGIILALTRRRYGITNVS